MSKLLVIPEEVRTRLKYDPTIPGGLLWNEDNKSGRYGSTIKKTKDTIAGAINRCGYYQTKINTKKYMNHRIIWFMFYGNTDKEVDHIDGNRQNNDISNLRLADACQNAYNRKIPSNNKSGVKGVYYRKSRNIWVASISYDNKYVRLGNFDTFEEAKAARLVAEKIYHKEFASQKIIRRD